MSTKKTIGIVLASLMTVICFLPMAMAVEASPATGLQRVQESQVMDLDLSATFNTLYGGSSAGVDVSLSIENTDLNTHAPLPYSEVRPTVNGGPSMASVKALASFANVESLFEMRGDNVKQSVLVTNPTSQPREYRVTFTLTTSLPYLSDGSDTWGFDTFPATDAKTLTLLDQSMTEKFRFSFADLATPVAYQGTTVTLQPTLRTSGDGNNRLDVSVQFTLLPNTVITLDPTYSLLTVANLRIHGGNTGDNAGTALASGDINGDGYGDLIIGAPWADGPGYARQNCGEVYILFGTRQSLLGKSKNLAQDASCIIYGANADDRIGSALACADIDNDGKDDIIIGAPFADGPSDGRRNAGEVYVIFGDTKDNIGSQRDLSLGQQDIIIYGITDADNMGWSLAVGDIDGDNCGDMGIGTPYGDGPSDVNMGMGEVYVIYGDTKALMPTTIDMKSASSGVMKIYGEDMAQNLGLSVGCGNINGDSYDDIMMGSNFYNSSRGVVYIIYGTGALPVTWQISATNMASKKISGISTEDYAGYSIACGDVDHDGKDDLVAGAYQTSGQSDATWHAGEVYVYLGATLTALPSKYTNFASADITIYGQDANDRIGFSLAVGDLNADRFEDILIGSPYVAANNNQFYEAGETYVILGNTKTNMGSTILTKNVNATYYGEANWDRFGWSVCVSNLDGDGKNDTAIGGPYADGVDDTYTDTGCVDIIYSGGEIDISIYGAVDGEHLGYSVASGDFNGDGYQDIIMGAPYLDRAAYNNKDHYNYICGDVGALYITYGHARSKLSSYYDMLTNYDVFIWGYTYVSIYDGCMPPSGATGSNLAVGNLNDDGYDDIAVGCPTLNMDVTFSGFRSCAGAVAVMMGSNVPSGTTLDFVTDYDVMYLGGATTNTGKAVAIGDIDGDGYDDLVLSAYKSDADSSARYRAGRCYIYYGSNTYGNTPGWVDTLTTHDTLIEGDQDKSNIGFSLSCGDMTNDGKTEVVIGSINYKYQGMAQCGVVYVLKGGNYRTQTKDLRTQADLTVYGAQPYDQAGFYTTVGDINNDGFGDLFISATGGDGPYDMRTDSGDVYTIYGSSSLLSGGAKWLRNTADSDVVFYGACDNDKAGYSVAVGEMNGDSFNDLIIGSPNSDGNSGMFTDTGCVSLVFGDAKANIGTIRDLASVPNFYGIDARDKLGYSVAAGDIDQDGKDDLIMGAPYSGGPSNSRLSAGDVYATFGKNIQTQTVSLDSFTLTNGGLTAATRLDNKKACFAGYQSYDFKVNLTDILGLGDVTDVTVHMDPLGNNIRYKWTRATGTFNEVAGSDPSDLVQLDPYSYAWNDTIDTWGLDFLLKFNWNYPDEGLSSCRVVVNSVSHGQYSYNYSNIFRFENDLQLAGELIVLDEDGAPMAQNDWIRGLEPITWTNMSVVYENSTTNPMMGAFGVAVLDPQGRYWYNATCDPTNIRVVSIANNSNSAQEIYHLMMSNLTGTAQGMTDIPFTLCIDAIAPPKPMAALCHADSPTDPNTKVDNDDEVYLTWSDVTDTGGSGMLGYFADHNDTEPTTSHKSGDALTGTEGGSQYFYVRARDKAGNWGPAAEANLTIDTRTLHFTDPVPSSDGWVNSSLVSCSVTIVDDGGGGIDIYNVYYKVSLGGPSNYYNWEYAKAQQDGPVVTVTVQKLFQEGENNFIRWKAQDLAGNGFVESDDYQIRIDSQDGKFLDPKPPFTSWNHGLNLTCSVRIDDTGSGVDAPTIEFRTSTQGVSKYGLWKSANWTASGVSVTPSIWSVFVPGPSNFIQWRAKDNAGNQFESNNYQINIDNDPPLLEGFEPNSTKVHSSDTIACEVTITDAGGAGVDLASIQYAISTYDNWLTIGIGTEGYGPWTSEGLKYDATSMNRYVTVTVNATFKDGLYNYIKWRVKDLAGNGYVESPDLQVRTLLPLSPNPPVAVITFPEFGIRKTTSDNITFDASGSYDPDNDPLKYYWSSNISGELGEGKIMVHKLSKGHQRIRLNVSDGYFNVTTSTPIEIIIDPLNPDDDVVDDDVNPDDDTDDDTGTDDDTTTDDDTAGDTIVWGLKWQDLVIALLLLALVIAVIWHFGRQKGPEEGPAPAGKRTYDYSHLVTKKEPEVTCPHCDSEIPKGSEFCPVCGEMLKEIRKVDLSAPPPGPAPAARPPIPAVGVQEEDLDEFEGDVDSPVGPKSQIDGESDFDMDSFDDAFPEEKAEGTDDEGLEEMAEFDEDDKEEEWK